MAKYNSYNNPNRNGGYSGHDRHGSDKSSARLFYNLTTIVLFLLALWAVFIFLPRDLPFMQVASEKAPFFVQLSDAIRSSLIASYDWVRTSITTGVFDIHTVPLSLYFILINIIALITMVCDKEFAEGHKWRVSEGRLFFLALIGGSLGTWIGMYTRHHKTTYERFSIGVPSIFLIESMLGVLIWYIRTN